MLRQAADLGGVRLLSFVIVLNNACAVIGDDRTIEQALPLGAAGVLHADMSRHGTTTGYISYGEWIVLLSVVLIAWSVMLQVER